jgi:hypothetical protein
MKKSTTSPRITNLAWGRLDIEGGLSFKDVKLFPGGAREWNWRETGTDHCPGIQPEDVEELIAHGARAIVLSKGMDDRLQVCPETLSLLEKHGVRVYTLRTEQAVRFYNELREQEPVGGLFHSTC